MKNNTDDIEAIENFLSGRLTEAGRIEFDDKVATNKDFSSLVKDVGVLIEGVNESAAKTTKEEKLERLTFFAEVLEMEATDESEEKSGKKETRVIPLYRKPSVLAVAASVALLIAAGAYILRDQTPLHEKVFITYFEPFDSPGSGLTRGNTEITVKANAYDAYDNGRYPEAVVLFRQVLKNNDDPIMHLCLGSAQLKLNQFADAEITFNHLLTEHSDLVTQTKWYLALTYVRQNKLEKAKATLWEISKSSTYGEKARTLLTKLE